ncbi:dual specificity phosphatase 28 [Dryobates pubescens]|uniref:dual specificity phosphatase 28 n=1 Tax=Dryobates pubescens TaxID=118200 RepID=UPI0023B9C155|nr:dual specificity phosphatase 28 [Dryobates pubescens]
MIGGALKRFQLFQCRSQAPAGTRTYPKPPRSSLCRRDKYSTAQPRCIAGGIHPHPESPASLRTGALPGLECGAEEPIWGFCREAAVPVTLQSWLPMLQLCKVTSSLLISNAKAACNEDLLTREGVTFCVNVTRQQPFPSLQQVRGIRVPVFDDPAEDLYRYFEQCSDAIEEAVKSGGKCLVYCKNGRSRSAAICTAYLMRHQKLPLKDAFETVKAARPVAEPNSGFWSQLQRYEEDLQIQSSPTS